MKKLFYKILLLVIIIFVLNRITYEIIDAPFYWQSEVGAEKELIFDKNKDLYNTIFIGSSRTYRQIDPVLFDSLTAAVGSKSFNYGVQNLFAPYTHILAYQLLEQEPVNFDILFVELTKSLHFKNLDIPEFLVWEDINLEFAVANTLIKDQDHPVYFKLQKSAVHTFNVINKASNANLLDYYFDRERFIKVDIVPENGFLPLDEENKIRPTVKIRNDIFMTDTTTIIPFNKKSDAVFGNMDQFTSDYERYHQEILELIEKAKEKQVQVYFYLPNRFIDREAKEIVGIFNQLPEENKLSVSYNDEFKKLYLVENNWDRGHLNKKGATIFTKLLAEAYLEKKARIAASAE